jgi:hypothetical protein
MKSTQRRFVVEYKNGRRQPKARTTSIWGDTDLKSLARQVENEIDAPASIAAAEPSRVPGGCVDSVTDQIAADGALSNDRASGPQAMSLQEEETKGQVSGTADVPSSVGDESGPDAFTARRRRRATREVTDSRISVANAPAIAGDHHKDRQTVSYESDCEDDLVALDTENRRLKRLMVGKLRTENARLRAMLQRFGVV